MLIGRDGGLSTLCHSWGFDYQQGLEKRFLALAMSAPRMEDGVVLLWHLLVNLYWVFFHEHAQFTRQQAKGGRRGVGWGISLIHHHHFHPLQRHLDISWEITTESLPLHIASRQNQTGVLFQKFAPPCLRVRYATEIDSEFLDKMRQIMTNGNTSKLFISYLSQFRATHQKGWQ